MGWRGHVDHASITLYRPGQSLKIWLPLQSLQGYLGLRVVWVILISSTLPARLTVTGCFPTCLTVVGSLDHCLSSFFLFFLFFFFLFTELLASELSPDEEDETEGDIASEEGEEDLTGKESEGST
jgi:hypothetical protein